MASQRPSEDVRLYITNPDGTQTFIGEMQATLTQHTEPYPDLEQVLQEVEASVAPPPPPEAIAEEPAELTDMERLLQSFTNVQEGNLYSSDVNTAIDIIAGATNMQEALRQMEENGALNFKQLLFQQIDRESKDLDRFMFELQKIPSLPSMDVDYI